MPSAARLISAEKVSLVEVIIVLFTNQGIIVNYVYMHTRAFIFRSISLFLSISFTLHFSPFLAPYPTFLSVCVLSRFYQRPKTSLTPKNSFLFVTISSFFFCTILQ